MVTHSGLKKSKIGLSLFFFLVNATVFETLSVYKKTLLKYAVKTQENEFHFLCMSKDK